MSTPTLTDFLDENGASYETIDHPEAYTAQEVAAAAHVPGKELAKPVMVKLDGEMTMVVVPASFQVDLEALVQEAGAGEAELASEEEFEALFPDAELGAMPPFGSLYDLPVYVDGALKSSGEITFSAGSHSRVLRMSYADYERLEQPRIGRIARPEA